MRVWSVPSCDAANRRFKIVEAILLHTRCDLGAKAAKTGGFVRDDATAGLVD
jgi:hypothetical protein